MILAAVTRSLVIAIISIIVFSMIIDLSFFSIFYIIVFGFLSSLYLDH